MSRIVRNVLLIAALALAIGAIVWRLNVRDEPDLASTGTAAAASSSEQIARGAYLARAGNCMHCHTARGGAAYAGGRGIDTPFGTVYSSNLTPDPTTGLGRWSSAEFYRALHNGRSSDGRLLYPAFPYPNFTIVSRDDADALFAFLQSLPPFERRREPHALRWPYSSQLALAVWRALYFRPATFTPVPDRTAADWNRGAYLARGLAHCSACHGSRDALGGLRDSAALAGGTIPMQNWYAPSLTSLREAGVADWSIDEIVQLLGGGVSPRGIVSGPMGEVVQHGTRHLSKDDLRALASYLKLPLPLQPAAPSPPPSSPARHAASIIAGRQLYEKHCAQCHGENGEGRALPGQSAYAAYPPLAGNRAVVLPIATNLVQTVLFGGFPPATAANPRPFGMPPFVLTLDNTEIAAVLSYIRSAWGNDAAAITPLDVGNLRSATNTR